jgi:hypothetical protein
VAVTANAPVPDGALAAAAAEFLASVQAPNVGPAADGLVADPWNDPGPWIGA